MFSVWWDSLVLGTLAILLVSRAGPLIARASGQSPPSGQHRPLALGLVSVLRTDNGRGEEAPGRLTLVPLLSQPLPEWAAKLDKIENPRIEARSGRVIRSTSTMDKE